MSYDATAGHPAVAEIYRDTHLVIHGMRSWLVTREGATGTSMFYGVTPEAAIRAVADAGEMAELCRTLDAVPGAFTVFRVGGDGTVVIATSSLSPGVYVWRDADNVLHAAERLATPFELGHRLGRIEPLYLAIQLEHGVERFQANLSPVEGLRHVGGRMSLVCRPQQDEICGHTARAWPTHIENAQRLRKSWRYQLGTSSFRSSFTEDLLQWARDATQAAHEVQADRAVLLSGGVDSSLVTWALHSADPKLRILTGCTKGARLKDGNEVSYVESAAIMSRIGLTREAVEVDHLSPDGPVQKILSSPARKGARIVYGFMEGLACALEDRRTIVSDGQNGDAQYFPEYFRRVGRGRHRLRRVAGTALLVTRAAVARLLRGRRGGMFSNFLGSEEFFARYIEGKPGALGAFLIAFASHGTVYGLIESLHERPDTLSTSIQAQALFDLAGTGRSLPQEIEDKILIPIFGKELYLRFKTEPVTVDEFAVAMWELHHHTWLARNIYTLHAILSEFSPNARYYNFCHPKIVRRFRSTASLIFMLVGKHVYYRVFRRLFGDDWDRIAFSARRETARWRQSLPEATVLDHYGKQPQIDAIRRSHLDPATSAICTAASAWGQAFQEQVEARWKEIRDDLLVSKRGYIRAVGAIELEDILKPVAIERLSGR